MKPSSGKGVLLEIRLKFDKAQIKSAIDSCKSFLKLTPDVTSMLTQFVISEPWWPGSEPGSDLAIYILSMDPEYLKAHFTSEKVSGIVSGAKKVEFIVTAENLHLESLDELLEHFSDRGLNVTEKREVICGFMIHPYYTQDWTGNVKKDPKLEAEIASSKVSGISTPPNPSSTKAKTTARLDAPSFSIRQHPVTGKTQAISIKDKSTEKSDKELRIPLLHLLRVMAFVSRNDNEVPLDIIYSQIERLKNISELSLALNATSDDDIYENEEKSSQLISFLDFVNSVGFSMPTSGRIPVVFEGIPEVLDLLKTEYKLRIEGGDLCRKNFSQPIEYMALPLLYRIGDIVTCRHIGNLSGTLVGFKIVDSYFEALRSLLGGRKFSFRLNLESMLLIGGEFVSVRFTYIFEEWRGERDQSKLPFKRCLPGSDEWRQLEKRANLMKNIDTETYSYHHYSPGSFFPHLRKNGSLGSASAADTQASSGRLILDSERGSRLGHSPAQSNDELGLAISHTVKSLQDIKRALAGTNSTEQRNERIVAAGLKVFKNISSSSMLIAWPAVVAFSLSAKTWGHALVDGLSPVVPDQDPWNQLILPIKTKEVLGLGVKGFLLYT